MTVLADLTLELVRVGHRQVLGVAGEIDIDSATALPAAIDQALDSGALDLWIDLTDVTFMDSAGVHALLAARTRVRALGRHLVVICPPGGPRRTLVLSGLDRALTMFATRAEAHHGA
jgi:anti-sigma B factor antagonist